MRFLLSWPLSLSSTCKRKIEFLTCQRDTKRYLQSLRPLRTVSNSVVRCGLELRNNWIILTRRNRYHTSKQPINICSSDFCSSSLSLSPSQWLSEKRGVSVGLPWICHMAFCISMVGFDWLYISLTTTRKKGIEENKEVQTFASWFLSRRRFNC